MKWLLFAFALPWALLMWCVGLLSFVLGFAHRIRFEGAGIMTMQWREWFGSRFGYSTTLGRLIWFQAGERRNPGELDDRIERHERVHVRQVEDLMLLSFIVGLIVAIGFWVHGMVATGFWWWLGLWTSGGAWQLPNYLTAMMRYGYRNVYRDCEHERSAYAQTDTWPSGESWWTRRDQARDQWTSVRPPVH